MANQLERLESLRSEIEKISKSIVSDRSDVFIEENYVKDLLVSQNNEFLYVQKDNKQITVYNLLTKSKIAEISPKYKISSFCEAKNKLFICGDGLSICENHIITKEILENSGIHSVCAEADYLFCLSPNSLQRVNIDSYEVTKELYQSGKRK